VMKVGHLGDVGARDDAGGGVKPRV
jgi:hypothetical protein